MNRRTFLLSLCAVPVGVMFAKPVFAAASKVLVAYFSATGTTKEVAKVIAGSVNGDLYEIMPEKVYTNADLDWNDKKSRSSLENANPKARPKIAGALPDMSKYDTVFLGYPIWWGYAPRIVQTFVEACDLKGKTIIPFCTSGGSPFGNSADLLIAAAPAARWKRGKLLKSDQKSEIVPWATKMIQ